MNIIKYSILVFLIFPLYGEVDYNSEIQPIFDNNCISCHIDGGAYFGGLDLSSYSEVMEGGDSGNTIVPFDHANSLLWQHVNSSYMPPYGSGSYPLTTNQIDLIAQWIDEGAFFEPEEDSIEGRWHLVGYEDAIMYQFVDTEPFADAGLRYSIYVDENGEFDDLDGDNIGGTPHPYSVVGDIITIDTHFGNILSYQMNYRCDGQVVEFIDIDYDTIHSTLFREGFDYFNSDCEEVLEECFDFTNIDFGACTMVLGVGLLNDECSYISGCDWTIDDIDYSDLFFDSIEECQEVCSNNLTVTDIDGNVYQTVQIGDQLWMAENLKVTHYNNGDAITHIANEEHWGSMDEGQYGVYDDEPTNANIYGNIYNWAVIGDIRGICPVDWHVPSDDEYTLLTDFLGGESIAGGKMKEAGLEHWNYDSDQISLEATNESGFTGLPAGHRNTNSGDYIYMGFYGYFWSSTENGSDLAWRRYLIHYSSGVARDTFGKPNGFSIRCLRD